MAIMNFGVVTKAIETLLRQKLTGFVITRNARKNADPNICLSAGGGWIGIYRGSINYDAYVIGNRPWLVSPEPFVNIQIASVLGGDDAEDRLEAATKKVIDIIETDRTLGGTVSMVLGYSMDFEYNDDSEIYFHGVNIRIKAETRS